MKGRIITMAKRVERTAVPYPAVKSGVPEIITIRAATVEDIPAVLALWAEATAEPSATDDDEGVLALLRVDPESLLLAVEGAIEGEGEAIVGTVIASWDGWRGAMYRLAVLPSHRRRRIAAKLVERRTPAPVTSDSTTGSAT